MEYCLSHPARGAWIEIRTMDPRVRGEARRTPHGVRGLKLYDDIDADIVAGRTPHGVRGLKSPWKTPGLYR